MQGFILKQQRAVSKKMYIYYDKEYFQLTHLACTFHFTFGDT